MLKLKKEERIAILIDFDGTITTSDSNDKLVDKHINHKIKDLLSKEGDMEYVDFINAIFGEVRITEENYLKFILSEVDISHGFKEFYDNAKSYDLPIAVVSGGFHNGIIPFLEKFGIIDIDVYANSLNFDGDNITVTYYDGNNMDCCDMGPCGNCKLQHYEKLKSKGYKVIFIGDGVTDQSVAREADIVFAKDGLEIFCKENHIEYIAWNDFQDINNIIFKNNQLFI